MPSHTDDDSPTTVPYTNENRSSEVKRQKPLESQQIRAKHEASRILEDVTGSPIGYSLPKSGWAANKRIPYLYYINDKKTILIILQGDITRTKVDAIVNAANEHMTGGGGVDGIIHDAAGEKLYHACKAHKEIHKGVRLPTGHSRILLSYDMSKTTYYIINTAGPRYNRYRAEECDTELRSCYKTALTLAGLYDLESVAFTAISCGIFGYPVDDGAKAALETVDKEADCVPVVVFVLWDDHIYDEWKRTAAKLNLIPIDPKDLLDNESSSTATTTNDSEDRTEEQKTTTVSDRLLDEPVTDKIEQPKVTADSDQSTDALATQQTNDSLLRLPSVPKDEPDTQIMDSQDAEENNSNEEKPLLTTQKTAEMVDVDNEEEKSTENTEKSVETVPVTSTDNTN